MLLRVDGRWSGPGISLAAGLAGRIVIVGIRGMGMAGWRLAAGACGVLLAGWLGSQMAPFGDAAAEGSPPDLAKASSSAVTGALRNAALDFERPDWAIVQRQAASFTLGIMDLGGQPVRFSARRDLNSPMREDVMRAGDFAGEAAALVVAFRRQGSVQPAPFFIDMSRNLSEAALSPVRTSQPLPLQTKFGMMETADVVLSDGARERSCLIFRHVVDGLSLRLHGMLCGTDRMPSDRQQLVCLIDRVALVSAGEDRDLRAHFAAAELKRQPGCHVPKHQAAGRRANWLDPEQGAPKLRRSGG